MGRWKLSELSDHKDDEVSTQSEDVYNDGRDSQGEEDKDGDVDPGELDNIDTDNDLDMENWPRPPARTAQKQTLRTTEIQQLKEKTTQLQKRLAIANCIIEGKSRKGQENPVSAEEFEGPESEEDTPIMYSAVATPLPSMSTLKAPQLNLNRLLSTRKFKCTYHVCKFLSYNTINTTTNTDTGSQVGLSDTQINITAEPSATLPLRPNWQPGEAILLRAMQDFEACILGQDFFPDQATCLQWVEKIRGQVYKGIQVNIVSCYKFDTTVGKCAVKQNIALSRLLLSCNFSGFSYKDREAWSGYAEHSSLIFLLSYIFDESNMGMVFEKYFNPISLQTLASLFTMVKKFSEEEYDKYYKAYLIDLTKWDGMNPAVSLNIRHQMYAKARIRMCEDSLDDPTVHIVGSIEAQLRQEMEARTGETKSEREDSEMDDDSDKDDCSGIEA
ncbi:hypothetical protein GG344DRAFT_70238 [Lentinula edodes]|nr:hypothetical protein GG344DRAFT_70238 [Lentinula edodes]